MLDIRKNAENETLTMELAGRLDTTTAPLLEGELNASLEGIK